MRYPATPTPDVQDSRAALQLQKTKRIR